VAGGVVVGLLAATLGSSSGLLVTRELLAEQLLHVFGFADQAREGAAALPVLEDRAVDLLLRVLPATGHLRRFAAQPEHPSLIEFIERPDRGRRFFGIR